MIDINEIVTLLPHSYPFLLVDRVLEFEAGKRVVGIKNITFNEPFFTGHFPGRPIMPGVLIVEAMAQAGGILAFKSFPDMKGTVLFLGIDNARFRKPVIPGDQLKLQVEVVRHKKEVWIFEGQALVDDEIVAEARIMAMLKQD
ncbi:3-hydroxyacyl-ACP dehydratase FabZ [Syntrophorhabdus aromaticivorans]|mgnify:CR=1 FL=1|jgi:beta-hydroxyacyl-ACP dehydratase FabZ|uniref:3-hydroxyacyl-[acyl-carrier-protein] dehydratase FabZ n=1 Tax=Syntrophorhabdus aromaticivorans TaxID=328301 RepID=A0A351U5D5_9BACT|nr:3-hydroxyacyl-ACP dehydratase FabZ [Syntrophorhabdus aromaticivorans]NLW34518.1 3-hydroxyacyl-ACP dehydratase FabZ [Syntrophorhabdus aromaticivorans]HBA55166.1 3-hydroxyacyl-[acyl-carrier-protein] dehydratase FabZ [Syntrophorhabdus aromaticivorans]